MGMALAPTKPRKYFLRAKSLLLISSQRLPGNRFFVSLLSRIYAFAFMLLFLFWLRCMPFRDCAFASPPKLILCKCLQSVDHVICHLRSGCDQSMSSPPHMRHQR